MRKLKEAKTIVDERGVMVITLESLDRTEDSQYFGVAKVMLPVGTEEIRFPIPARSLDQAFDMYDDELQRFSDDFQKQVAANSTTSDATATQEQGASQA